MPETEVLRPFSTCSERVVFFDLFRHTRGGKVCYYALRTDVRKMRGPAMAERRMFTKTVIDSDNFPERAVNG